MEGTAILGNSIQLPPQRTEAPPVYTMTMRRGIDIWSRLVNRRMDHVSRGVQQATWAAVDDIAFFVDEDQIRGFHEGKRNAEGINPEGGGVYWVLGKLSESLCTNTAAMALEVEEWGQYP